ncbi:MAG: HNH endonuclease signature motif containing protein, partial [bacterium]|nr:HNH endonuclease signature motif containing protein [bacterium]
ARDKGCIGCAVSPNWCQAHHDRHWEHGGGTDIDNMCLLCSHCHQQVHTNRAQIIRSADGRFTFHHRVRRRPAPAAPNGTHNPPPPNPPTGPQADITLPLRC